MITPENRKGFTCSCCGTSTMTTDSRPDTIKGRATVRRRRSCPNCDHRVTTFEVTKDMLSSRTHDVLAEILRRHPEAKQTLRELLA